MATSTTSTGTSGAGDLAGRLTGRVITAGDDGYDAARVVVLGGVDPHPAVIARPVDDADVAAVVGYARETGQPLAVRSGGHSGAGYGTVDDGIVLDLRDMTRIDIDVDGRTAWVESGVTAGEFTVEAAKHGLAVGFGDTGSVGLGGLVTRRRRRLPGAQARAGDRQPARRRRRHRRRAGPSGRRRHASRSCSGRSAVAAATTGW